MLDPFSILRKMAAADAEPVIDASELESILAAYAKSDRLGNSPQSAEWIPTYDLRAAAAEAWRRKAARAAELVSSDLDGDRLSANQVFEHCERMAKMYSKSTASPAVGPPHQ
jgi:hypothetical protein